MFVYNNVEIAGEVESQLTAEQAKYNARGKQPQKAKNLPLSKGVLIFDEVKLAAKLYFTIVL